MKTIRERIRLPIFSFIFINYSIVAIYYKYIPNNLDNIIGWSKTISSIIIINLFISVINGIVPRSWKEILVFWKINNRLPGFKCFSKLIFKDARISVDDLKEKLGILPTEPKKQNELWYKVYKEFENDNQIIEIHRLYVLSRDLASIILIIILTYCVLTITPSVLNLDFSYFITLIFLIQYFILIIVSRNYCNQFVLDVLAKKMTP